MKHVLALLALAGGVTLSTAVWAEEQAGCTGFEWPLDTELTWMAGSDDVALESGGEIAAPPAKAISLSLQPSKTVTMPVTPGIKKQAVGADSFSGWFTLTRVQKPGLYQISLSDGAWIDAAQNGALVRSSAFTGQKDCKVIHKSVRFEISSGPVTVQISGAPGQKVRLAIRAAN
jgi:hypothetical protein